MKKEIPVGEIGDMVASVRTNLVLPDGLLRNNMQPLGCGSVDGEVSQILVTRYWVAFSPNSQPRWERRAELFLDWCLPSVVGQTRPPQAWLLLVSDWAYDLIGDAVHQSVEELSWAHLVPVPTGRTHSSIVKSWVVDRHPELLEPRWKMAFRLDSDDAIARDFLDAAAKWVVRAKPKTPSTLNLAHGLQHDLTTDETRLDMHGTNHFTGIITQKAQPFIGAFGPNHTEVYVEKSPATRHGVHQLNTRWPMWVEILHERNAANHFRPGPPMCPDPMFWFDRFSHRP